MFNQLLHLTPLGLLSFLDKNALIKKKSIAYCSNIYFRFYSFSIHLFNQLLIVQIFTFVFTLFLSTCSINCLLFKYLFSSLLFFYPLVQSIAYCSNIYFRLYSFSIHLFNQLLIVQLFTFVFTHFYSLILSIAYCSNIYFRFYSFSIHLFNQLLIVQIFTFVFTLFLFDCSINCLLFKYLHSFLLFFYSLFNQLLIVQIFTFVFTLFLSTCSINCLLFKYLLSFLLFFYSLVQSIAYCSNIYIRFYSFSFHLFNQLLIVQIFTFVFTLFLFTWCNLSYTLCYLIIEGVTCHILFAI